MPSERLAPSAILAQTNLSGVVSAITDDPDSPDGSWLTAIDDGNDTDLRVSFATPLTAPVTGVGVQNFRLLLRASGGGDDPIATVYLYENGVLRATGVPTAIPSTSGQVLALAWDATLLTDPTGAGVECRVSGLAQGGFLDPDDTVEVGAVEWNATTTEVHSASYASSLGPNSAPQSVAAGAASYLSSLGPNSASADVTGDSDDYLSSIGVNSTYDGVATQASGPFSSVGVDSSYDAEADFGSQNLSSVGVNSSYTPTADFCSGDIERLPPDAILEQTNLVGTVTDIEDNPDSPDGSWLETPLLGLLLPTSVRTSFPTPDAEPCGQNEFRALVRTTVLGIPPPLGLLAPTARLELWEAGSFDPVLIGDSFDRADQPCPFVTDRSPGIADTGQVWLPPVSADAAVVVSDGGVKCCPATSASLVNQTRVQGDVTDQPRTIQADITLGPGIALGGRPWVQVFIGWENPGGTTVNVQGVPGGGFDVVVNQSGVVFTQSMPWAAGETHELKAELNPQGYLVLVDGVPLYTGVYGTPSITPSQYSIGFVTGSNAAASRDDDGQSRVDNFLVTDPNITLASRRISFSPEFAVTSGTGEVISWFWDPSILLDPTGAGVEARIVGTPAVLDLVGWTVEVGAVEWNAAPCSGCLAHSSLGIDSTAAVLPASFAASYLSSLGIDSFGQAGEEAFDAAYLSSLGISSWTGGGPSGACEVTPEDAAPPCAVVVPNEPEPLPVPCAVVFP